MRPTLAPPNAARLSFFLNNWLLIRPGPEIRHYVKGVQLDTPQNLYWTTPPHNCISTAEQHLAANQEINRLLVMGAIETVEKTYFLKSNFSPAKSSGQWRLILNLKALNKHLNPPHFKMEGLHCIKYTVSQGNWLAKIDLKDAYLSVAIQKEFRKFLQFLWQGKTFQYRARPFGLSIAPYVFTKLLQRPLSYLRSQGIKIIAYLDDMLLTGPNKALLTTHINVTISLFQYLGFIINWEKSIVTPQQTIEFLGIIVDTRRMLLRVPQRALIKIKSQCRRIAHRGGCSARELSALIGLLSFTKVAIPIAPLFYRALQFDLISTLQSSNNYNQHVHLSQSSQANITWWMTKAEDWNSSPILRPEISLVIQTDASLTGWGACCQEKRALGAWSSLEKTLHINLLELKAISFGVKLFASPRTHVLVQTDNTTTIRYVNRSGGTHSLPLCQLATQLLTYTMQFQITLTAEYIPGKENITADALSRQLNSHQHMASLSESFRSNPVPHPGIPARGPFCISPEQPVGEICELASRPRGLGSECLRIEMEGPGNTIHVPPANSHRPDSVQVDKGEDYNNDHCNPFWPSRPWWPLLLESLIQPPVLLPQSRTLVTDPLGNYHPHSNHQQMKLLACVISGDSSKTEEFRTGLLRSFSNRGALPQRNPTNPRGTPGHVGVYRGQPIPLTHLQTTY